MKLKMVQECETYIPGQLGYMVENSFTNDFRQFRMVGKLMFFLKLIFAGTVALRKTLWVVPASFNGLLMENIFSFNKRQTG